MQQLQDKICQGLEQLDGIGKFQQDEWDRVEGGGGRSRVMREGAVFEQGGVGFSEVWGSHLYLIAVNTHLNQSPGLKLIQG